MGEQSGVNPEATALLPEVIAEAPVSPFIVPLGVELEVRAVESGVATGLNVLKPLVQTGHTLLMVQAYGYKGDESVGALGGGLILRRKLANASYLEFNAFFDALQDEQGFSYPQVGAGIAAAFPWVTFRVNGYLPLEDGEDYSSSSRSWKTTRGDTTRDWSQRLWEHRSPTGGADIEAELHLPHPPKWIDPRLTGGYYYRTAVDGGDVYAGAIVRGELRFGSHISVEGEWRSGAAEIDQEWRVAVKYQYWFGADRLETTTTGAAQPELAGLWRDFYGPAQRNPWPGVAKRREQGSAKVTGEKHAAQAPAQQEEPQGDCCSSGSDPLIFD